MSDVRLQVLREIDKLDKIKADGVRAMLTTGMKDASGAFNQGLGLHPFQADFLVSAISGGAGDPLGHIKRLCSRINMMVALEKTIVDQRTGETAWGLLLNTPGNADETWGENSRPANIGWALDDLVKAAQQLRPLQPEHEVM
jgi:hypothetical protein